MKILIADDHALLLEAVQFKLNDLGPGIKFVLASTAKALQEAISEDIDLAIIDLAMPGTLAYEHILAIRQRFPQVPLVVLSASEDAEVVRQLLDHGVRGFISKSDTPDVMLAAIRLVLSGGIYVPPLILWHTGEPPRTEPLPPEKSERPPPGGLTARQAQVLKLLACGFSNKAMARELQISEGTVKIHLAAIFRALGVRNRTEAASAALTLQQPD
jgi:DNA-binding NarL/FixJ family response regulator